MVKKNSDWSAERKNDIFALLSGICGFVCIAGVLKIKSEGGKFASGVFCLIFFVYMVFLLASKACYTKDPKCKQGVECVPDKKKVHWRAGDGTCKGAGGGCTYPDTMRKPELCSKYSNPSTLPAAQTWTARSGTNTTHKDACEGNVDDIPLLGANSGLCKWTPSATGAGGNNTGTCGCSIGPAEGSSAKGDNKGACYPVGWDGGTPPTGCTDD